MGTVGNMGILLGVGGAAYGIDQWSKSAVRSHGPEYTRIGEYGPVTIRRSENKGMVGGDHQEFSQLSAPWVLGAVPIVSVGLFLGGGRTTMAGVGAGLIVGGGVGNMEDRVTRGSVTDFLRFRPSGMNWNLADGMVATGGVLSVLAGVRYALR